MFRNLSRHTASEGDRGAAVQRRLILLGSAMALFFELWAAVTPLHEMVSGEGLIQPEGKVAGVMPTIGRTVIVAPVSGRIQPLSVRNAFQVIAPGDLVAEIVPKDARLIAEVEVGAAKVGAIVPGMKANVKMLTYDFVRFGGVAAVVAGISPTSAVNQKGETVFKLKLSLASGSVGGPQTGRVIRPGCSVIADIRTGRKTVLTYLLQPVRVIGDRAMTEG